MTRTTKITYPVFALFALACFAFAAQAQVVCQQGCDPVHGNTILGDDALISNTIGGDNTATGIKALQFNTTGSGNTAIGAFALLNNTQGLSNTAVGDDALYGNTIGDYNTAIGTDALGSNSIGEQNTAIGLNALQFNTTGARNEGTGFEALWNNTTGASNTADGFQALVNNTTGSFNIAVGHAAGGNLTTGVYNIDIGNNGVAGDSRTIRIGKSGTQTNTFVAGISGATVPTGVAVIVDASGHLGTATSSARFKEAIKPMDRASEAILALKPVTFRYKQQLDPNAIPQFGLVAEQVAKVNPDLVVRDEEGKPYTVRYEAVNAMLLNEFLKEHRAFVEEKGKVQALEANAAQQQRNLTEQQKRIDALTAGLQKVSAQLEVSKSAIETVVNDH